MITERITHMQWLNSVARNRIDALKELARRSEQLVRIEVQSSRGYYCDVTIAWDSDSSEVAKELDSLCPRRRIGPCRTMNSIFGL